MAAGARASPDLIRSQHELVTIFGVTIARCDVFAIAVTIPLLIGLLWFICHTRLRQGDARHGAGP